MNVICEKPVCLPGRESTCSLIRPVHGEHEGECIALRHFSTDDRRVERVASACDHPRCPPGKCRAYSDAYRKVTDADAELGRQLVAEGWWSTSAKYCSIARWKERVPTVEELFRPELLDTFHGQRLARFVRAHSAHQQYGEFVKNEEHIERATCSFSVFAAFKAAGGDCAH